MDSRELSPQTAGTHRDGLTTDPTPGLPTRTPGEHTLAEPGRHRGAQPPAAPTMPGAALPGTALPGTALPGTALPGTALPQRPTSPPPVRQDSAEAAGAYRSTQQSAFAPAPAAGAPPMPLLEPLAARPAAMPAPAARPPAPPVQTSPPVTAPPAAMPPAPPPAPVAPAAPVRAGMGDEFGDASSAHLGDMLIEMLERGASDLHLTGGARPTIRLNGALIPLEQLTEMTPPVLQKMIYSILTQKQREVFEETLELDFAYALPGRARFRVNVYRQRDTVGAAFRLIPYEIKKLEDLGVPPTVGNFAMMPRGFVLVTGPTGSGKSTTLAAIVDLANRTRRDHIMTVEDPIEFLHQHQSCLVNQREVGEDTMSFQNALKHVLRQDPDIILVGEMRDLETISVALTAAETGHLVFATLHTQDAAQTIDRVIDVFPPHQQQQIRVQLAGALQGVVCQTLCKTRDGRGRVVATEVLMATPAIRNLIREGKTHQIYSALQAGAKHGMNTMDQSIAELVKSGRISYEQGLEKCHHVEDFNRLCGRV